MKQRRVRFALFVLIACASSMLGAQSKDDKKKDEAQKREIQSIVKSVDDLAAGQPAANDLSLTWVREDVLKAQGNKEYVPFTVQIDPSKVSGGTVAFYWRVLSKNAPAPAPVEPGKKDNKKDKDKDKGKKSDYAYEDISFMPVTAGQPTMKISRSFTVPAGNY